jgi:hypothetical protein
MNKKFILLCVIIVVTIYLLSYYHEYEYLTYDENTFMDLKTQQKELEKLNNQYDNSIPPDEKITNDFNQRDRFLLDMTF